MKKRNTPDIKLKPCPFCGGEPRLKRGFPRSQTPHCRQAVVQCKECGCRTVLFKQGPMERWQDIDGDAVKAWNKRSLGTRWIDADAVIEQLKEYIEEYAWLDENGMHNLKWCAMMEALGVVEDAVEE